MEALEKALTVSCFEGLLEWLQSDVVDTRQCGSR